MSACLLVIGGNSLDPDHAQQDVGPELYQNCLTGMQFLKKKIRNTIRVSSSLDPDQVLFRLLNGNMIRYDPTLEDLTSNFFVLCTKNESLFI